MKREIKCQHVQHFRISTVKVGQFEKQVALKVLFLLFACFWKSLLYSLKAGVHGTNWSWCHGITCPLICQVNLRENNLYRVINETMFAWNSKPTTWTEETLSLFFPLSHNSYWYVKWMYTKHIVQVLFQHQETSSLVTPWIMKWIIKAVLCKLSSLTTLVMHDTTYSACCSMGLSSWLVNFRLVQPHTPHEFKPTITTILWHV